MGFPSNLFSEIVGVLVKIVKEGATWTQAIFTVVIAILTFFYVKYTVRLVAETKQIKENENMPVVVVRFRELDMQQHEQPDMFKNFKDRCGTMTGTNCSLDCPGLDSGRGIIPYYSYRLINIGKGPALNLKISGHLNGNSIPTEIDNILGQSLDPQLEIQFSSNPRCDGCWLRKDASITVDYEDIFGKQYQTLFKNGKCTFHRL